MSQLLKRDSLYWNFQWNYSGVTHRPVHVSFLPLFAAVAPLWTQLRECEHITPGLSSSVYLDRMGFQTVVLIFQCVHCLVLGYILLWVVRTSQKLDFLSLLNCLSFITRLFLLIFFYRVSLMFFSIWNWNFSFFSLQFFILLSFKHLVNFLYVDKAACLT